MSFLSSQDISASRYKYEDHGPAEEIERKIAAGQTCDPQDETVLGGFYRLMMKPHNLCFTMLLAKHSFHLQELRQLVFVLIFVSHRRCPQEIGKGTHKRCRIH